MATTIARHFNAERMLELVETALEQAGVHVPDALLGTTSTPRKHESARVSMESTNTQLYDNTEFSRVEDIVTVELSFQLRPSNQRETRRAAYALSRKVTNKLTSLSDRSLREGGGIYLSTVPLVIGEWYTLTNLYRFRRDEEVGREV